jgi:predicted amidohydrolase YtcJ
VTFNAIRIAIFSLVAAASSAMEGPTLIGNIHGYTLVDGQIQQFDSIAFDAGKILATGTHGALSAQYPRATNLDGGGSTLLPGLMDAHGHVTALGEYATRVGLFDTKNLQQAQARIKAFADANPGRAWDAAAAR